MLRAFAVVMATLGTFANRTVGAQIRVGTAAGEVSQPMTGRLLGVFDLKTGEPLKGVYVYDVIAARADTLIQPLPFVTKEPGLVGLGAFRAQNDTAEVAVRLTGYIPVTLRLAVGVADTIPYTLTLESRAEEKSSDSVVKLAEVVTTAKATVSELESRVKTFSGKIITGHDLRHDPKLAYLSIGDALLARGINLTAGNKNRPSSLENRRSGICSTRILLNGVDARGQVHLRDDPAENFTGVEFYPSGISAPIQFQGSSDNTCGMVVIWTMPHA
jgi:hypothetical protein